MLRISQNYAVHSYTPMKQQNLVDDAPKPMSSSITNTSLLNTLTNFPHLRQSDHKTNKLIIIEQKLLSSHSLHTVDSSGGGGGGGRSFLKKENFFQIKDRSISDETSAITTNSLLKNTINATSRNALNSAKTFCHGFPGIFSVQADSRKKLLTHSNSMCSVRGDGGTRRYDPKNVQRIVLDWCVEQCKDYSGVKITNFSSSFADGLAFCAIMHNNMPDAFDFSNLSSSDRRRNFELAFETAHKYYGIVPLLEVNDMLKMGNRPDEKCIFTYLSTIYSQFRRRQSIKPTSSLVSCKQQVEESKKK